MLLPQLVNACDGFRKKGVFNCLLSDGDWLFSFCTTKLAHITRRAPFGPAQLRDAEVHIDFKAETTPNDVVTIIATEPLTSDEVWTLHQPGEWHLWWDGEIVSQGRV
jgi:glutamine amidotransferase